MNKLKHIITVVGARPQFVKAAAISRCIQNAFPKIEERIVHTGQHFDDSMSKIFFDEMQIPAPTIHLGSSNNKMSIGQMIDALTVIFSEQQPEAVLVYGDTHSTFAASVAANACQIPLIHVEAGLRSFNKSMPEEINRIFTDHASTLLFCPTQTGIRNLESEGFNANSKKPYSQDNPGVFLTGDIMLDNLTYFSKKPIDLASHPEGEYFVLTMHRPQNADHPDRLQIILKSLMDISKEKNITCVFPVHPRTQNTLSEQLPKFWEMIVNSPQFQICGPQSYLSMIDLLQHANFVVTDSGGLQKEAHFFNKPIVILRKETEWTELINDKNAILVDADPQKIAQIPYWLQNEASKNFMPHFGNGHAAEEICRIIEDFLNSKP